MEKALPEHERLETLAHLAACEECRKIVFLVQKDLLPAAPAVVDREPWWKGLWRPAPIAGIAFACLFLVVASVGVRRILDEQKRQTYEAKNQAAVPPPVQSHATEVPAKPGVAETPRPNVDAGKAQERSAAPTAQKEQRREAPEQAAPKPDSRAREGFAQGVSGDAVGGIFGSTQHSAGVGAQPSPAVPAASAPGTGAARGAASGPVAQLSMKARNFAPPAVADGLLHLTIEHGQGADDGLTEIHGTVRDTSGAVIPKATITLRGPSGQVVSAASNAEGGFTIASLPAGQYEIQVASVGFQSLAQSIDLQPRDLAQIDPVLPVGSTTQTVDVTADAVTLQTESAAVASTVEKPPPGGFVSQVALNGVLLGLDANGALFRTRAGDKHWKKVKAKWHGAVVQLSIASEDRDSASSSSFVIVAGSGDSWTSPDGRHWKRR